MTKEDLKNAVIETGEDWADEMLPKGFGRTKMKKRWLKTSIIAASCALLAAAVILFWPGTGKITTPEAHAFALAEAEYPAMMNGSGFYLKSWDDYKKLSESQIKEMEEKLREAEAEDYRVFSQVRGSGKDLEAFFQNTMRLGLGGSDGENALIAPVNYYLALAMLSELTAGDTQQEILDAIGAVSASALRGQAKNVWRANYYDNGYVKCILGSSCWLSDSIQYRKETVGILRDSYYASVFRGKMGSDLYDDAFRDWVNANTGGLLKESVSKLSMDPATVAQLVSTFYFQDQWDMKFDPEKNTKESFYTADGEKETEFMHCTDIYGVYYYGDHFAAYGKALKDSGAVLYLILPDEDADAETLLKDPQLLSFLTSAKAVPNTMIKVNLSMPKFDISEDADLREQAKAMGIRKAFALGQADFSPLTGDTGAYVSGIKQGARIIADEDGVKAASYMLLPVAGAPMPPEEEVDLVLNRPFFFVLRSRDDLPLLAGIVNNP